MLFHVRPRYCGETCGATSLRAHLPRAIAYHPFRTTRRPYAPFYPEGVRGMRGQGGAGVSPAREMPCPRHRHLGRNVHVLTFLRATRSGSRGNVAMQRLYSKGYDTAIQCRHTGNGQWNHRRPDHSARTPMGGAPTILHGRPSSVQRAILRSPSTPSQDAQDRLGALLRTRIPGSRPSGNRCADS